MEVLKVDKLTIAVINGPNINILGKREPQYYGNETWDNIEERLKKLASKSKIELFLYQSNHEGNIVDFIQNNMEKVNGAVINPAAFTKHGYSILDALTASNIPFVEVHLSNIFSRGGWHAESIFSEKAVGVIAGFRGFGYEMGLNSIIDYLFIKKRRANFIMSNLGIISGTPTKTKPFMKWPYSNERELELVSEVITSGQWWRMTGTKVVEFEKKFAEYHNSKYCLGVTNGTHAIELALTALGIGKGDEVIVPAVTFISTATAVIYCNATPVLVDIDKETFNMLPEAFEKAITPKTKAVIPVHMAGHPCDMERICEIAKKHNIKVIEDAAHGHGGECNNKKIGSFGDVASFSFQNGKIMTCGEGGAIVTNNKELYDKAFLIHGVGRPKNDTVYEHSVLGSNYRMNEFQAAILIAQLERLKENNITRERNATKLDELLKDVKGITPQKKHNYATVMTHYMYMFYYDSSYFNGLSRKDFVEYLKAEGIPTFISFPVLSDTTFFKENAFAGRIDGYDRKGEKCLDNAHNIAENVVWLPHFTLLGDEQDVNEIAMAIKKIQNA